MRRKRWLRSNPANAMRVAVRSELPWRVKAMLLVAAMLTIALIVGAALIALSSRPSVPLEAAVLSAEVEQARADAKQAIAERDSKLALLVQLENQQQIDRAASEQVQVQLKALENENARLKEDLAFFESLLPTPANAKGVVIRSFRLQALNDERENGKRAGSKSESKTGRRTTGIALSAAGSAKWAPRARFRRCCLADGQLAAGWTSMDLAVAGCHDSRRRPAAFGISALSARRGDV